jgi:hypothetical protein
MPGAVVVCTVPRVELLFEVLLEFVGSFVFESFAELGFRGARAVWRNVLGRALVHAAFGFGAGALWAQHVEDGVREAYPNLLWTSLIFTAAGAVCALVRERRESEQPAADPYAAGALPWHWPAQRWAVFAALNAGIAAGVIVFFDAAVY